MSTVKVFDPPMCCSTGVCGTDPDIALARFAADIQWLQNQGVAVERYSLSQQPDQFINDAAIMQSLKAGGTAVLPIVMVNDHVVSERQYPSREQIAEALGLLVTASAPALKPSGCCGPRKCC